MSIIGPTTYGVLKNLVQPDLPKEKRYKDLVKILLGHYMPKPLKISERFKFNKRNQKEGESVNLYVVELKILSIHCEFGAFLPEALRDRLVCGLRSETTQKKLFSETNLDFDKAVQISHAKETAEKDTLAFFSSETAAHNVEATKSVRKLENRKKFQKKHAEECFRCGNNHYSSECRFKESKCLKCQKPGHFSKKCPPRKKPDKPAFFVDRGNGNTSDSEDSICSIFCTNKTASSNKKFTVKITVGRENVLVDTGSVRTIIGESVLRTPGRMLL